MATSVTASSVTATLGASVADAVKFSAPWGAVKIINHGAGVIYFRTDGTTAVPAANGTIALLPYDTTYVIQHFDNGGSSALAWVSLVSTATPTYTVAGVNIHGFDIDNATSDLTFTATEWAASTSYSAGDYIIYRGNLYRVSTTHTSTSTFNDAYFTRYTSGGEQLGTIESLIVAGHSYVDYGGSDEGEAGRPYFFGRLRAALGVPYGRALNMGMAGSTARWSGWPIFQEFDPTSSARWPLSARTGGAAIWLGANDAVYGIDDGGWREHSFKQGLLSTILRTRVSRTYNCDDASVDPDGTWTTATYASVHPSIKFGQGSSFTYTTDPGAKLTITTPADMGRYSDGAWVNLYFAAAQNGATGTVWLDGVEDGDLDTGMGAALGTAFQHGEGVDPGRATVYTYRLYIPTTYQTGSNSQTTQHSIEIRFGASIDAGVLAFTGWAIEATIPPPCLVLDVVQIANSVSGLSGAMSDTSVADTYSTWIEEVIATVLDADGNPDPSVIYVAANDALGGTLGTWTAGTGNEFGSNRENFLADGVHLSHIGAARAVDACVDALTEALQLNIDRINTAGSMSHVEKDPLTEPPFIHRGAGTPVAIFDDFERAASEAVPGGSGVETNGSWGIDSEGQLYCVDPLFAHYLVRDDFARTSLTSLGRVGYDGAGTVRSWVAQSGSWATNGSVAYLTAFGAGHAVATLELSSATTQTIEAQTVATSGLNDYAGLILRYVDANNYLLVTTSNLGCRAYKMLGGVLSLLGTFAGASVGTHPRAEIGADDVLRVWNSETGVPSSTTFAIADAALMAAGSGTKVGLWLHSSSGASDATNFTFTEFKAGTTASSTDARTANAGTMILWDKSTANGYLGVQQGTYSSGSLLDITQGAGMVVRKASSFNYYKLVVSYFGFWVLYRVDAGVATQIASWWVGQSPGVVIYIRMNGNDFSVYNGSGVLQERYDSPGNYTVTDATHTGTNHGIYHPYHDGVAKMRWRDVRWGQALTSRLPRRGDQYHDTTNAPDSVVVYGPYESGSWGTGTTFGQVAGTFIPYTLFDGKGEILAGTAADAADNLAAGTAGQSLITDSAETTGLKWAQPNTARSATWPTGALMATTDRYALTTTAPLVSGRLHLVAIDLPKGLLITSITFVSSTTALVTGTNQWFGLFDSSRVPLRLTADDTSTAWAATTAKTLTLSSTFTTTYAGLHYIGIMVAAATVPTLSGTAGHAHVSALAPILSGASSTGLTTPASCPNPAGAITAGANIPWAYVS